MKSKWKGTFPSSKLTTSGQSEGSAQVMHAERENVAQI